MPESFIPSNSSGLPALTLDCDCPVIDHALPSQRVVELVVEAPQAASRTERPPLNLALVLDRSGSMGGQKLQFAQQAACHVLDQLDARDRVAVVAYDDEVRLLSPSVSLNAEAREHLKRLIQALKPGGSTDLSGGWLRGAEEAAAHLRAGSINRVLLLTDGLANVGITDPEELAFHAQELRRRDVTTSTFGVGADFNQFLLEALAEKGGGHYYFIDRPSAIPDFFRQELGELLTVVAREASLRVHIPSGTAVELAGDLPHEKSKGEMRVFLGDIFAGERRVFYLKVLTPPGTLGVSLPLRVDLSFATLAGQAQTVSEEAAFVYAQSAGEAPRHRALLERAGEVDMAAAAAQALRLEREGWRQEASQMMHRAMAAAPCLAAPAAAQYSQQAQEMEEGLSEQQSKEQHAAAYKKRFSRK